MRSHVNFIKYFDYISTQFYAFLAGHDVLKHRCMTKFLLTNVGCLVSKTRGKYATRGVLAA
jgi:hypothetical protein